jgi:lipopolysaccharide export LptBFGC system permease protein LptF
VRGEQNPERLEDVRLFQLGPSSELVRWIEAGRLTYVREGRWQVDEATELHFSGAEASAGRNGSFEVELPLRPEVTQLAVGRPEWMPLSVLTRQVPLMAALQLPTEPTRFAIHHRWAAPIAAVLAALVACLLGLRGQRGASVPRALLEGAALYGGLFVVGMISRSLAINGRLAPPLAAWLAPLVLLPVVMFLARPTGART